jgi:hypothetical protein
MGPAYALAAITLLFDPTRAEDDLRVLATVSMLRRMDDAKPDAFSESYRTVADDLEAAWRAAKQQTGVTINPSKARVVEAAVAALFKELDTIGYSYFGVAEWKSLSKWAEKLREGTIDAIEILPEHDLRHALNAAWLARLDSAEPKTFSEHANRLADRVKVELTKRHSDRAGPLRVRDDRQMAAGRGRHCPARRRLRADAGRRTFRRAAACAGRRARRATFAPAGRRRVDPRHGHRAWNRWRITASLLAPSAYS